MELSKIHYGDYSQTELAGMSPEKLIDIIMGIQNDDNFILMTDSYKMTHHLLLPDNLQRVYSYMEPRGGEMPYTVFFALQYYIKRYLAGRRITLAKIEEARQANIAHFGFDCFDDKMWLHILEKHDGHLPLEIKAVPEGTPVAVKNVLLTINNTDFDYCASLANITETLLMKIWAPNTVGAYNRVIKELITRYHAITSDLPSFLIDYMHHDFGYRGTSSEETARICSAAAMLSFKGTDTLGGCSFIKKYYNAPETSWADAMAGYSVIASEHSVMCSYGGRHKESEAYRRIIQKIKNDPRIKKANPSSGIIIVSLVSDTYNIYNVTFRILVEIRDEFEGWVNDNGIPMKIVVRPDSGVPANVLFGYNKTVKDFVADVDVLAEAPFDLVSRVADDMSIEIALAKELVEKGVFQILFDQFGSSINSKGYRVFNPQIGILQGDGIKYSVILEFYLIMTHKDFMIDIMMLNLGSGGKNLQAHDRDEQKYAIKATKVKIAGEDLIIQKNPITDAGKKSKAGELKLVRKEISADPFESWKNFITIQEGDEGYDETVSILETVFLNGKLTKEYSYAEARENAKIN